MSPQSKLDRLDKLIQLFAEALDRDEREQRKRDDEFKLKVNYLRERNLDFQKRQQDEEEFRATRGDTRKNG